MGYNSRSMSRWREEAFPVHSQVLSGEDKASLDLAMSSAESALKVNKVIWQHPHTKIIGPSSFPLVAGLIENSLPLTQYLDDAPTPSAHRTYPFRVKDYWGEGIYVVKGVMPSVMETGNFDVAESITYNQQVRFPTFETSEAGKQSAVYEAHDIGGYLEIDKHNPGMSSNVEAPFWHPLLVTELNETIYDRSNWSGSVTLDSRVVSVRRFPYTHWRIEDVTNFPSAHEQAVAEIDRLQGIWGLDEKSKVYLKAIARWGLANQMMMKASVRHRQVFNYYNYDLSIEGSQPGRGQRVVDNKQYAWINPNNISLCGATGDLDCHRRPYYEPYFDEARGRHEAIGGLLMYLAVVERLNPELISDPLFFR